MYDYDCAAREDALAVLIKKMHQVLYFLRQEGTLNEDDLDYVLKEIMK